MDVFSNIAAGFGEALTPMNLLYALIGCIIGTLIGVLPGVGSVATVALLIPLTFGMDATSGLIMMAGVYYGAMYGGSTTSILVNTPGESSSTVTTLDGYQMARHGRAGPALATAAIGSFVAGTISTAGLMLFAPALANLALQFGPAQYFAIMVLGLTTVSSLASSSVPKSIIAMLFGLGLATIGLDMGGWPRFTFGRVELYEGIDFLIVAIGLFAVAEVFWTVATIRRDQVERTEFKGRAMLSREEFRQSSGPWFRGSFLGFIVGILPGAGATIASFLSYTLEKRLSRYPERFGKGTIEGVAGPEAANNASVGGAMIPMMTLGIPGSGTTAVLMAAFLTFGLQPGPMLFEQHSEFAWALIASMYVGNVMLLVLNLPLVGLFARLINIRATILFPMVLVFSIIGVYSVNRSSLDVLIMLWFGVLGYFFRRYDIPPAPVILAMVLGPSMELNFRRAMSLSNGDPSIFISGMLVNILWLLALLSLFSPQIQGYFQRKRGWQVLTEPATE